MSSVFSSSKRCGLTFVLVMCLHINTFPGYGSAVFALWFIVLHFIIFYKMDTRILAFWLVNKPVCKIEHNLGVTKLRSHSNGEVAIRTNWQVRENLNFDDETFVNSVLFWLQCYLIKAIKQLISVSVCSYKQSGKVGRADKNLSESVLPTSHSCL